MIVAYRGKKVELDDGRELIVPAFPYLDARKHGERLRDAENEPAMEYVFAALLELIKRNHPEITLDDLQACSTPTIWELWGAGMRTTNEGTIPGEAKRAK